MASGNWVTIGNREDIPVAGARVVVSPGGRIAVFRTEDNQVFALEDRCPHRRGPLSQGIVHGSKVTCPLHGLVIDLASGAAEEAGAAPVRALPVRVGDNGDMLMNIGDIRAMQQTAQSKAPDA